MESGSISRGVSIRRDEWLAALRDAGLDAEDDAGAVTITEFGAMMGMKRTTASRNLKLLVEAGKARETRKRITDGKGRSIVVTAYRLEQA